MLSLCWVRRIIHGLPGEAEAIRHCHQCDKYFLIICYLKDLVELRPHKMLPFSVRPEISWSFPGSLDNYSHGWRSCSNGMYRILQSGTNDSFNCLSVVVTKYYNYIQTPLKPLALSLKGLVERNRIFLCSKFCFTSFYSWAFTWQLTTAWFSYSLKWLKHYHPGGFLFVCTCHCHYLSFLQSKGRGLVCWKFGRVRLVLISQKSHSTFSLF